MKKATALLISFSLTIAAFNHGFSNVAAFSNTNTVYSVIQNMDASNTTQLQEIMERLEIESIEPFIQEQLSRTSPPVPISRIKDLDGTPGADVSDAMYILYFLSGEEVYDGDYNDMDATADYIIDEADARAYLAYYIYCVSNEIPTTTNYSAPGAGSAPSSSFENIEYEKHIVGTDYSRTNDTTYTLYSSAPDSISQISNEADAIPTIPSTRNISLNEVTAPRTITTFETPTKKRIVANAGSGAIIGEHLILTNAHCLFNLSANQYNSEGQHIYLGLDSNNSAIFFDATAISYHIPVNFFNPAYGNGSRYDYAIVVVSESLLTTYDCEEFSLGLPLDGAWNNQTTVHSESFFTRPEPSLTHGILLYDAADYFMISSAYTWYGASGGPLYTKTYFNNPNILYDTQIGIDTVVYTYNNEEFAASGAVRIIRPILQFCFNNSNL